MAKPSPTPLPQRLGDAAANVWSGLLRALARLRYTAPIWVPTLVLAQVVLLGFRPALTERERLGADEARLTERHEQELERRSQLRRLLRAYNDPMYIARRERSLLDPDSQWRRGN